MILTIEHSFPDELITSWRLKNDYLEISITGVFFENSIHEQAEMIFKEISQISCMVYENNEWQEQESIEPLKDICKFNHKLSKNYSLQGFGSQSGQWTSIEIISERAEIQWK